ncbi:hypothetical protein FGO68_gene1354 [Halteria grandinella]|uniref:Uncharacterized protein n=1 Tax=Halteria grandinella TaxID=5974 RepID=A0A8J8T9B3_HALGN|nr:hypothetical protein FGO68_gene1354 [Halteria grandinella]
MHCQQVNEMRRAQFERTMQRTDPMDLSQLQGILRRDPVTGRTYVNVTELYQLRTQQNVELDMSQALISTNDKLPSNLPEINLNRKSMGKTISRNILTFNPDISDILRKPYHAKNHTQMLPQSTAEQKFFLSDPSLQRLPQQQPELFQEYATLSQTLIPLQFTKAIENTNLITDAAAQTDYPDVQPLIYHEHRESVMSNEFIREMQGYHNAQFDQLTHERTASIETNHTLEPQIRTKSTSRFDQSKQGSVLSRLKSASRASQNIRSRQKADVRDNLSSTAFSTSSIAIVRKAISKRSQVQGEAPREQMQKIEVTQLNQNNASTSIETMPNFVSVRQLIQHGQQKSENTLQIPAKPHPMLLHMIDQSSFTESERNGGLSNGGGGGMTGMANQDLAYFSKND